MTLLLLREQTVNERTYGVLFADGVFHCHTLEDAVRPVKVQDETAIPEDTYQVIITLSPRFKRPLPRLVAVPGFEGILIHPGNSTLDTSGCILPGFTRTEVGIGQSRLAFEALFDRLKRATAATWITIRTVKGLTP